MPRARKRSKADPTFNAYIGKILKRKHGDMGISKKALCMANGVAENLLERLVVCSGKVARAAKKGTMTSKHVQAASKVMLPFELSKAAVVSATAAMDKFVVAA